MTDVHTKSVRSYNMRQIKSKDTKPEILVRKYLFSRGLRYRVNYKVLPGSPDIYMLKYNVAIQINGCFWHGHENCKKFVLPKTNTEWWRNKIAKNIARDIDKTNKLIELGVRVITIWECSLKSKEKGLVLENLYKDIVQ